MTILWGLFKNIHHKLGKKKYSYFPCSKIPRALLYPASFFLKGIRTSDLFHWFPWQVSKFSVLIKWVSLWRKCFYMWWR